jgi:hypothetical protein
MPTMIQYETVKQQCNSFMFLNHHCEFKMQSMKHNAAPIITIMGYGKTYKFSDPDWNVVSMQLAKLFQTLKRKLKK